MDKKAEAILSHYKRVIECNEFDEYIILGFMIFIRSYIHREDYPGIYEFCDLVAHRNRNRGTVMTCIAQAIENHYETIPDSKKLKGYQGITKEEWDKEWIKLGEEYHIRITEKTVSELMICVFSLAQYAQYSAGEKTGEIVVFKNPNGVLSLDTTESKPHSCYVCFSQYYPYDMNCDYRDGLITEVLETKRIAQELQLWAGMHRLI